MDHDAGTAIAVLGSRMLEGLERIDWASERHALGAASDVPGHLRALASGDSKSRDAAVEALFTNISHQGTVYPASVTVLPFLYELLAAPETPDRTIVAVLIACIAGGTGYYTAHVRTVEDEKRWAGVFTKPGLTLRGELEREATLVARVRAAASARLRDLLPYLQHADPGVRKSIAAALGYFPEHVSWSRLALESTLARETDEDAREEMGSALKALIQARPA